jgi:hypothetical protein
LLVVEEPLMLVTSALRVVADVLAGGQPVLGKPCFRLPAPLAGRACPSSVPPSRASEKFRPRSTRRGRPPTRSVSSSGAFPITRGSESICTPFTYRRRATSR